MTAKEALQYLQELINSNTPEELETLIIDLNYLYPDIMDSLRAVLERSIKKAEDKSMKILECSSKGDKRYSAFYARVSVLGVERSIEEHYQLAKRFGDVIPQTCKDAKGKTPTHFVIGNKKFEVGHLSAFYKMLWIKYLDANPELVTFAKTFDDFNDMFKGKSLNCQADVIRTYIKVGRNALMQDCKEFILLMKGAN